MRLKSRISNSSQRTGRAYRVLLCHATRVRMICTLKTESRRCKSRSAPSSPPKVLRRQRCDALSIVSAYIFTCMRICKVRGRCSGSRPRLLITCLPLLNRTLPSLPRPPDVARKRSTAENFLLESALLHPVNPRVRYLVQEERRNRSSLSASQLSCLEWTRWTLNVYRLRKADKASNYSIRIPKCSAHLPVRSRSAELDSDTSVVQCPVKRPE